MSQNHSFWGTPTAFVLGNTFLLLIASLFVKEPIPLALIAGGILLCGYSIRRAINQATES